MTQRDLGNARSVIGVALLLVWIAGLARVAAVPLTNRDTYFHLRFGREFLEHWRPWSPGEVTSAGTASWVPTQWLSEVVMATAEKLGGLAAVAWLFGAVLIGFALTLYAVCRRRVSPLAAAGLTIGAMMGCVYGLSARPQVLSYLFISVTAHAWLRTVDDGKPRWWLIPLTWVWAMCHGMWPLAVILGVGVAVAQALDGRTRRQWASYLLVPAASLVVAGLTPVGPRLYGTVLTVAGRGRFFTEWGSPDFGKLIPAIAALFVGATVLAAVRRGPLSWSHAAVLLFACAALVYSNRTLPVAVCVAAPLLATLIRGEQVARRWDRREALAVLGATTVALVVLGVATPRTSDQPEVMPDWLATEMEQLPDGTRILGDDLIGGYLVWRYPELDTVYFGYGDIYTTAELEAKDDFFRLNPGWQETVDLLGARIALLDPSLPVTAAMQTDLGWQVVHESPDLVMLAAP